MPEFKGTKLAHDTGVCADFRDIHHIAIKEQDKLLFDKPGVIGSGGNSGFQALNLAVQFGVTRILLIGFDMHTGDGLHWYGRNTWKSANNPADHNLMRWRNGFESQAHKFKAMGIDVVNASPKSALVCFRHRDIDGTLSCWGL